MKKVMIVSVVAALGSLGALGGLGVVGALSGGSSVPRELGLGIDARVAWDDDLPAWPSSGDRRLKQLYIAMQSQLQAIPSTTMAQQRRAVSELARQPRPQADADYIVEALGNAIHDDHQDWTTYRLALRLARVGMQGDERIAAVARKVLTRKRPARLSDDEGYAIIETIDTVGRSNSDAAVKLLMECTTKEFWKDNPLNSRTLHMNNQVAMVTTRSRSIGAIGYADSKRSLSALQALALRYPDDGSQAAAKRESEFQFEDGAARLITNTIRQVNGR